VTIDPTWAAPPPPTDTPAVPILVPVLRCQKIQAWPGKPNGKGLANYTSISDALTRSYRTDAHLAAYSAPSILRRLDSGAIDADVRARRDLDEAAKARIEEMLPRLLPDGVPMVLGIWDVDAAMSHAATGGSGDVSAPDDWWIGELPKIEALRTAHPGVYCYRTRGGYRLLARLAPPIALRSRADAEKWSAEYLTSCAYLRRACGIVADPSCADWTRLYRLPHATRDEGGRPEMREAIGDPHAIATWAPELTDADREAGKALAYRKPKKPKRTKPRTAESCTDGRGVLYFALSTRGWIGGEVEPGKWLARCPNEAAHTKSAPLDGSTVLYAPGDGETLGLLYCSHAHCQGRTVRDALAAFSRIELDEARRAAGVAQPHAETPPPDADEAPAELPPPWTRPPDGKTILCPGPHVVGMADGPGGPVPIIEEVGADDFARAVLAAIPADALYRWDCVVGRIIGEPGERRFARLSEHELRTVVDEACRIVHVTTDEDGTHEKFIACSRDLAALVLAAAGSSSRVRSLTMLARNPVYQPGFTLAVPGWNESGIFYDEPADLVDLTPRAEGALAVLDDLSIDFPFADRASRENVYGAMLTLVIRPAIPGPVPIHLVMAAMERTGKGLCIDTMIGCPILGRGVTVAQIGSCEEEREKRITTLIIQGATCIHLDNLPIGEVLDSASLASLATAYPTWSGRMLGVSRMPELPNRMIVFMSANNPKASGEIVKRTVPIILRPLDAHPEDRSGFVHPDATAYALAQRRTVLEALLGMIQSWNAAGCPPPPADRRMGRYEAWVAAVGGVLAYAGCQEWLGNYKAWVRCADEATADAETLVAAWAKRHGEKEITARQVLDLVEATETYPAVTSRPEAGRLVSLARRVLTPLTDRPVGGSIVQRVGSGSSSRYRLAPAVPAPSTGVPGETGVPCQTLTHDARAREHDSQDPENTGTRSRSYSSDRVDTPAIPGTPANQGIPSCERS